MILIIETLFLIAGIYALFTAKMPSWIIGKGYKTEGNKVHLIGGRMAVTLPVVLCAGFTIGFASTFADFDPAIWAGGFEILLVLAVAIIVTVVPGHICVPVEHSESTNANIEPR